MIRGADWLTLRRGGIGDRVIGIDHPTRRRPLQAREWLDRRDDLLDQIRCGQLGFNPATSATVPVTNAVAIEVPE